MNHVYIEILNRFSTGTVFFSFSGEMYLVLEEPFMLENCIFIPAVLFPSGRVGSFLEEPINLYLLKQHP